MLNSITFILLASNQLPSTVVPCSSQRLTFQTHLQSNKSDITTHPDYIIKGRGEVTYSITTGIERKHLYTVTINLVGNKGVVQDMMLNFSEFFVLIVKSINHLN